MPRSLSAAYLGLLAIFPFAEPAFALNDLFTDSECKLARQTAQAKNPQQVSKQPIGRFEPGASQTTANGFLAAWVGVFNDGAFGIQLARWNEPDFVLDLQGQVLFAMECVEEGPKSVGTAEQSDGTKHTRIFTGKALSGRVVQISYMKMPENFAIQLLIGYPNK